jgi:drug/metabolite transporter (DMT)-like permease
MASVTWAVGSSCYSKLSRTNSPFAVNFTRSIFVLPFFLIAAWIETRGSAAFFNAFREVHLSHLGWLSASVFASYGFGDNIFLWSTTMIGVPAALAIASIYPIWTALAGAWFQNQVLTPWQEMGLGLAVFGVAIVILSGPKQMLSKGSVDRMDSFQIGRRTMLVGVSLAFLSSFMWALNSYAINRGAQGISVSVGNAIRMVLAMILIVITSRVFRYRGRLTLSAGIFRPVAAIFFVEAFLGSMFYMVGMSRSPLAIAATLTSLAPILSVPVALALKLERFSLIRTLGIGLVVMGLCFLVGA